MKQKNIAQDHSMRSTSRGVRSALLVAVCVLTAADASHTTATPRSSPALTVAPEIVMVQSLAFAGRTPTATINDYTVINDAVQAAMSGTVIELQGTFNWTEPNAAASWAKGSNGTAGDADDFSILVPAGLNDLTISAVTLGEATIEGPGDLASRDLEAFLVFDGGQNQNITISNLRIRNFDLSIGMFGDDPNDFDGATIQNNYFLVPADLNASVAPLDVLQNIAIHFSFGVNQTISNNTIEISGDAVADTPNGHNAASVAMQSNMGGGNAYAGLAISNNIISVLNAQSADPETIIGIWENGSAHSSDITVTDNQFVNAAAGNNPSTNRQRAFQVTSHSSTMTTVTYSGNSASGANVGFQWLSGQNFAGNQPIQCPANTLTNCVTGFLIQSNGLAQLSGNMLSGPGGVGTGVRILAGSSATIGAPFGPANQISGFSKGVEAGGDAVISGNLITGNATGVVVNSPTPSVSASFNRIVGNGAGLTSAGPGLVSAENNWWGCNAGPGGAGCSTVSGNVDFDPWLVLSVSAAPSSIGTGGMSTVTAALTRNSAGIDTSASGHIPDGIPVGFGGGAPFGSVSPTSGVTVAASAATVFTAGIFPGVASVLSTVDGQTVAVPITIGGGSVNSACIQDDSNGNLMLINLLTGDYLFMSCPTGFTLTGKGTVTKLGCYVRFQHNAIDRRISASVDNCQKKATASIQTFGPSMSFAITDRNTTDDTCVCP